MANRETFGRFSIKRHDENTLDVDFDFGASAIGSTLELQLITNKDMGEDSEYAYLSTGGAQIFLGNSASFGTIEEFTLHNDGGLAITILCDGKQLRLDIRSLAEDSITEFFWQVSLIQADSSLLLADIWE